MLKTLSKLTVIKSVLFNQIQTKQLRILLCVFPLRLDLSLRTIVKQQWQTNIHMVTSYWAPLYRSILYQINHQWWLYSSCFLLRRPAKISEQKLWFPYLCILNYLTGWHLYNHVHMSLRCLMSALRSRKRFRKIIYN